METKCINPDFERAKDKRTARWATHDWAAIRIVDTRGSGELPWWEILSAYFHTLMPRGVSAVHISTWRGQLEAWHLDPSWTLPCTSLPLADFNLQPFPVIKHNHECNRLQGILWVLLVDFWKWGWFGGTPRTRTWHKMWGQYCVNCAPI